MTSTNQRPLSNTPYLVTAETSAHRPVFAEASAAALLIANLDVLRDELGFALLAFVVMPDRVHMLLVPGAREPLARLVEKIKAGFARDWNAIRGVKGRIWQAGYYEAEVRSAAQLARWVEFIESNPVEAGLARSPEEYAYSSATSGGLLIADAYVVEQTPGVPSDGGEVEPLLARSRR